MKSAVLRFLTIILVSVAVVAGGLFMIRQLGAGQKYAPLDHPIMRMEPLVILDYTPKGGVSQSMEALKLSQSQCPSCLIRLDVRLSLDDIPFVFKGDALEASTNGKGYFSLLKAEDIRALEYKQEKGRILALSQIPELFKNTHFYIVVHTRDASKGRHVLKALGPLSAAETIIADSPFRQTLRDIRTERPRWVYTTPPTFLMRVQMMHSLFIASMTTIWPDLLVFEPDDTSSPIPRGVIDEYLQRHKRIVANTDEPRTYFNWKSEVPSAGLLTTNLELALEVLSQQ